MAEKIDISENIKVAIISYLSGQWSNCDSTVLNDWLEASESNRELFRHLIDLWEIEMMLRREKEFDADQAWQRLESRMRKGQVPVVSLSVVKKTFRYAAIFILAFFLGSAGYLFYQKHINSAFIASNTVEYTVPYGSKTHLKLLDGSFVWLNAGSTFEYGKGYGLRNRNIKLSGEAYFEVAKNKNLPFIVEAKGISVRALGTKFNVKAYQDEQNVETILLSGAIELKNLEGNKQRSITLAPNQKAIYVTAAGEFEVSTIRNASEVSWIADAWVIENKKLGEFVKMLERRYNVKFTFEEPSIKEYEFGGTIKDETIEQVLRAISATSPLNYEFKNKQIILSLDENKRLKYEKIMK